MKVYEYSNNTSSFIAQYTIGSDGLVYQRRQTVFNHKASWGKWILSTRKLDDEFMSECHKVIEINHRAGTKIKSCILIHNGIKIEIEKRPFAIGRNLAIGLSSIVESTKKKGSVMFECENNLRSGCDYEILKFKIC